MAAEVEALLAGGAETAVQAALRGRCPGATPEALVEAVARACGGLPAGRLGALALALRWLGRCASGRRERLRGEAVERCVAALAAGDEPGDAAGAGAGAALRRAAGEGLAPALRRAQGAQAGRLLAALAGGPRPLSQANAEELLARRVYEGQGHFLLELLQNADDAGASRVHFEVDGGELRVTHDGEPFGPLDVLGVLSVGQSTKGPADIGLFGVGFKSVYAVTERPRVYSGPFAFEIGGMARPRPVEPLDVGGDTLLALPLDRPGVDPRAAAGRLPDPARGAADAAPRALALGLGPRGPPRRAPRAARRRGLARRRRRAPRALPALIWKLR